jgi:Uncharacterized protein involved in cytokinesis, contains TGc (transglutaminase/protease-like) domain
MEIPTFKRPYFKISKTKFNSEININPTFMAIRQHLLNRENSFEIVINNGSPLFVTSNQGETALSYLQSAYMIRMPFVSDDFDYLRQNIKKFGCKIRSTHYSLLITYEVHYLTTSDQEKLIDSRINEIIGTNRVNDKKNDFLKIKFIYDYILSNVKYDYTYKNNSAFDALFDKKAVCGGCAALLYRMLCMVNVPCRIITGKGLKECHAWNIVKVGGRWYNLDVTWDLYCQREDRTLIDYKWFLKGEQTFYKHFRDKQYTDSNFVSQHFMALIDYYN